MSDANLKMKEAFMKGAAAATQFEGTMKLYEAAVVMQDKANIERYRDELHSLLDMRLDAVQDVGLLTRQQILGD